MGSGGCRVRIFDFRGNFVFLTVLLCSIVVVATVLAVSVPEWVTVTMSSQRVGLWKSCSGSDCTDHTFPVRVGCRSGQQVKDRINTSAGMMVLASIGVFAVCMMIFFDTVKGCIKLTKYGRLCCMFWCICAAICGIMAASIIGNTFDNWLYCGTSYCDANFNIGGASCGMGFSYVLAIVATILTVIIIVLYCLDTCRNTIDNLGTDKKDTARSAFIYTTVFVLFLAFIFYLIAVATPSWYVAHIGRSKFGLFSTCTSGQGCDANKYPSGNQITITSASGMDCYRDGKDMESRRNAVAAFLFIPMLLSVFLLILFILKKCGCIKLLFTWKMKMVLVVLAWICFFSQFLALIIFINTIDSWQYCGMSYCEATLQLMAGFGGGGGGFGSVDCGKGFSFAMAILATICSFLLALMHLFELNDWLCFSNRASDSDPLGLKGAGSGNEVRYTTDGKPIPPGDWDHDAVSGYYWSETKYLFWDPESNMYYNPENDQWTNTC